jgi:hypothetical protein
MDPDDGDRAGLQMLIVSSPIMRLSAIMWLFSQDDFTVYIYSQCDSSNFTDPYVNYCESISEA